MEDAAQMHLDIADPSGQCMPSYILPQDTERFTRRYWRIRDAAEAWGVSYSTAKRLIAACPEAVGRTVVWLVTPRGACARVVAARGAPRPEVPWGNPAFRDKERQRELAMRRWQKAGDKSPQG